MTDAPENQPAMIAHTDQPQRQPWPAGCFVQGGTRGVVIASDRDAYRTAFVEAFPRAPKTFLRGEGKTISEAEDACWAQYQRIVTCDGSGEHGPYEPRQYRNGAGFCTRCGAWFAGVLPELPDDLDNSADSSLLNRLFAGDDAALATVLETMARADELPERGDA